MVTEIPSDLLEDMLFRARIARRDVRPEIVFHNKVDVADLSEYWAARLFRMFKGTEDSMVGQVEMDELKAVLVEATEILMITTQGQVDPDFTPVTEELLRFLSTGE